MTTYVAFLRAINLGANRKFGKDDQLSVTEAAGFTGVATHINTGNVRLETRMRSRARIEAALERAYLEDRGFEVPTIVFSADELCSVAEDAAAVAADLGDDRVVRHYVSLLKAEPAAKDVAALEARSGADERVVVRGRAAHIALTGDYHEARITNVLIEKHLGVATNRNLTVVRAVVDKWC